MQHSFKLETQSFETALGRDFLFSVPHSRKAECRDRGALGPTVSFGKLTNEDHFRSRAALELLKVPAGSTSTGRRLRNAMRRGTYVS